MKQQQKKIGLTPPEELVALASLHNFKIWSKHNLHRIYFTVKSGGVITNNIKAYLHIVNGELIGTIIMSNQLCTKKESLHEANGYVEQIIKILGYEINFDIITDAPEYVLTINYIGPKNAINKNYYQALAN